MLDVDFVGLKLIFVFVGMLVMDVMLDDDRVVIENGVWYIGNIV